MSEPFKPFRPDYPPGLLASDAPFVEISPDSQRRVDQEIQRLRKQTRRSTLLMMVCAGVLYLFVGSLGLCFLLQVSMSTLLAPGARLPVLGFVSAAAVSACLFTYLKAKNARVRALLETQIGHARTLKQRQLSQAGDISLGDLSSRGGLSVEEP